MNSHEFTMIMFQMVRSISIQKRPHVVVVFFSNIAVPKQCRTSDGICERWSLQHVKIWRVTTPGLDPQMPQMDHTAGAMA